MASVGPSSSYNVGDSRVSEPMNMSKPKSAIDRIVDFFIESKASIAGTNYTSLGGRVVLLSDGRGGKVTVDLDQLILKVKDRIESQMGKDRLLLLEAQTKKTDFNKIKAKNAPIYKKLGDAFETLLEENLKLTGKLQNTSWLNPSYWTYKTGRGVNHRITDSYTATNDSKLSHLLTEVNKLSVINLREAVEGSIKLPPLPPMFARGLPPAPPGPSTPNSPVPADFFLMERDFEL